MSTRNISKKAISACDQKEGGIYKIFSCQTSNGNYYVQDMPGPYGCGRRFRLMHDRKAMYLQDYSDAKEAIKAMLLFLNRTLVQQTELDLF